MSHNAEPSLPHSSHLPFTRLLKEGGMSFAVILAVVALLLSSFDYQLFSTWIVFVFMCGVPLQLVMTMQMQMDYPRVIAVMRQPTKGMLMTLFTIVIALVIATLAFTIVGKGIGPPGPILIMYMIMSVVVTFWLIPLMGSWPLIRFTSQPLLLGIGSLIASYLIALPLFRFFFDFSAMSNAPWYMESLDPGGLFPASSVISFFVTANAAMLLVLLTEMRLVEVFFKKQTQPILGLAATGIVLLFSAACWGLFVKFVGMDPTTYMVRVPVCFIFGVFLVDPLMQHQVFGGIRQPARGLCLSGVAACFAYLMYYFYAAMGPILTGVPLPPGAPEYHLELWVANALLGITFPVIVVMAKFFDFWPVKRENARKLRKDL